MRKAYPSTSHPSSFLNGDYTGPISSRTEISETSTFTSCSFNTQGQGGGAIFFHDTLGSLTVSDSLFEKCNSTSEHGGAIYGHSCGMVSINASLFVTCSSPKDKYGGGICIIGTSAMPEITESNFISCISGQDSGGLELSKVTVTTGVDLPVRECSFIGCIANGVTSDPQLNDADGGGLLFWENACTLGIANSLFAHCESKQRSGGCFIVINNASFFNVVRFCFYSENTAPSGRNALIQFNQSCWEPWDIIFFHCFTSDNSFVNSLVMTHSTESAVNGDWLPLGPLSYLRMPEGNCSMPALMNPHF